MKQITDADLARILKNPRKLLSDLDKADSEESLLKFIKYHWRVLEPEQPFATGWALEAICLPYDTEIQTEDGNKRIGDIVEQRWQGRVYSFNHTTGKSELRPILDYMKSPGSGMMSIKTESKTLSLTDNHPVFVVGRGYVRADQIKAGDAVHVSSLQEELSGSSKRQSILPETMLSGSTLTDSEREKLQKLQTVWQRILSLSLSSSRGFLFDAMFRRFEISGRKLRMSNMWRKKSLGRSRMSPLLSQWQKKWSEALLPKLWQRDVSVNRTIGGDRQNLWCLLQSQMCRSFCSRRKESLSCAGSPAGYLSDGIFRSAPSDNPTRWELLFPLFEKWSSRCSPYRQKQKEQRGVEPSFVVPEVSLLAARSHCEGGTRGFLPAVYEEYVQTVEREVWIPDAVYNIEVEGNNNYFAEGILVHNCEHLEAVTYGEINRLLMNVPPGFMKSLATDVFWPAWEWGPKNMPSMRYLSFSYSASLTERDNNRFRDLVRSPEYQEKWGDRFKISPTTFNTVKAANDKTGWKLATSVGGVGTGERGDRTVVDDPHNVKDSESDVVRQETVRWFRESLQTRLNNPSTSAIVVIMQRVHEADTSGTILANEMGYTHLNIPMEYDSRRHCVTSIGWEDPRTYDGELAFPERYPAETVAQLKRDMSDYAISGQFQQAPVPRGGGMLKSDWWQLWPPQGEDFDDKGKPLKPLDFPQMEYIIASLDTAMTTREENDYSALTVLGVWFDNKQPKIMVMSFWQERLDFHGLVEKVRKTCRARQVDALIIEAKNNGFSVAQEIVRICGAEEWNTILQPVKGDKLARAHSIQHLLRNGLVYAPERAWAELLIEQCATFPKGAFDDGPDSFVQGLQYLRVNGILQTREENQAEQYSAALWSGGEPDPLYDV